MNTSKTQRRFVALVAIAFASLLCLLIVQTRTAMAAGAVEMQVERIVKIAILEYNAAMRDGDTARWLKYFTDNIRRQAPQSTQEGKQAFADYYEWEFENFEATWTTRRMIVSGRSGAVEFEWEAMHKPSGEPLKVNMVAIFELASSGKFESVNFYFDTANQGTYLAARDAQAN